MGGRRIDDARESKNATHSLSFTRYDFLLDFVWVVCFLHVTLQFVVDATRIVSVRSSACGSSRYCDAHCGPNILAYRLAGLDLDASVLQP